MPVQRKKFLKEESGIVIVEHDTNANHRYSLMNSGVIAAMSIE
jgi:hypothetical protein